MSSILVHTRKASCKLLLGSLTALCAIPSHADGMQSASLPLHEACDRGDLGRVGQLLADPTIDVDATDGDGRTLFFHACGKGYQEIVKLLLESKRITNEHLNQPVKYELTPFWSACCQGHQEIVKLLLESNRITQKHLNQPDQDGHTPFWLACCQGHQEIVKLLLESERITDDHLNQPDNSGGWTPFWWACWKGHQEIVKLLLESNRTKEQLYSFSKYGGTALDGVYVKMKACTDPARWEQYSTIWELLVEKGGKFSKEKPWFQSAPQKPARPAENK